MRFITLEQGPHDPIILLHGRLTQKGNKNQASDCFGSKHKIWCSCLNCVGADGNHAISIAPYWIENSGDEPITSQCSIELLVIS